MQGTVYQVRKLRDQSFRDGERALKQALADRKQAQASARKLEDLSWDAAFWAKENPEWSKGIGANVPRLQRNVDLFWRSAQRYEASAAEYLTTARKAAAALARAERKAAPRQPPGLWVLLVVCWQGWRRSRA